MKRRPLNERTVRTNRNRRNSGREVSTLYCEGVQAPPTPEALHDDGRADDLPVLTIFEAEAQRISGLNKIAQIADAKPYRKMDGYTVELIPPGKKKGARFNSLKAAARAIGVNPANVSQSLRKNPRFGGYRWRVVMK